MSPLPPLTTASSMVDAVTGPVHAPAPATAAAATTATATVAAPAAKTAPAAPVASAFAIAEAAAIMDSMDPFHKYPNPKDPAQCLRRAQFATLSRTAACLINEGLAEASIVSHDDRIFAVMTSERNDRRVVDDDEPADGAVFELQFSPIMTRTKDGAERVFYLDPTEMSHKAVTYRGAAITPLVEGSDLMRMFGTWAGVDAKNVDAICGELASSVENQAFAYANSPLAGTPSLRDSQPIEWEQSVLEGHVTHPMHKARYAIAPLPPMRPSLELYNTHMRFVTMPKSELSIIGDFGKEIRDLTTASLDDAHRHLIDDESIVVIPVHSMQVPNVLAKFPLAVLLPETCQVPILGQASMRTVTIESVSDKYCLKLPIGIKISSALRTITPWTTNIVGSIQPALDVILDTTQRHGGSLLSTREYASVVSSDADFDKAKHLSCVVRESSEAQAAKTGDRIIICASLTEEQHGAHATGDSNEPRLPQMYNIWPERLSTLEGKVAFLREYSSNLIKAVIPALFEHSFAFEAHGQNMLVRVHPDTGAISGFVARDYGGIKFHPETLAKSTAHLPNGPVRIAALPDNAVEAHSLEESYRVAYHTVVQMHLFAIIRALGLYRSADPAVDGLGWRVVREEMDKVLPQNHLIRTLWLETPTCSLKSFISMKLDGLYRDYVYSTVPNMLCYTGNGQMLAQ